MHAEEGNAYLEHPAYSFICSVEAKSLLVAVAGAHGERAEIASPQLTASGASCRRFWTTVLQVDVLG